jgi:ferritin-like metal-binding protein YciE
MKGILAEGDSVVGDAEDNSVRDASIIASAQRVEHYEIAGYGTVRTYAKLLGKNDIANLLEQTLQEEKEADQTLRNKRRDERESRLSVSSSNSIFHNLGKVLRV